MPKLYPEDQEKVDKYLNSRENVTEREPFRPLMLLLVIGIILLMLTGVSVYIAKFHGVM